MDRVDNRLDTQEASIHSLDRERGFGSGVCRQEPEQKSGLDQLGEMAEDTDPRTALDNLYSRLKKATPADGIYSPKGSAVPPTSSFDEYIPSKDDERLDFTRGNSNTRGRSRQRRNKERGPVTDSDRSLSPLPPKLQIFSGDPTKGRWLSFIMQFERIAIRHGWSEAKKLDRLLSCLTEKALEFEFRCKMNNSFQELKNQLKLRFDLSDEPVAACQKLNTLKQEPKETLESFMQQVLNVATDGYGDFETTVLQQMAVEAFLRGCRNKESASLVLISTPKTIQEACQRLKTIVANKKALEGPKVSFQERLFSAQEEKRVSDLERKVSEMTYMVRTKSPHHGYRSGGDRNYYSDRRSSYRSPQRSSPERYPLTGTRGIHHTDITVHRPVIFRVLRQVISLAALHAVMGGIRLFHLQGVAGVRLGTDIHLRGKVPPGGIRHLEGTLTHLKGIERDTVHQVIVDMVKIIATIIEVMGLQPIGMALGIGLRGLRRGLVVRHRNAKYPRI